MPIYKMDNAPWTDYNPNCSLNNYLQKKYQTGNSHDYRYFLQRNAEELRKNFSNCAKKEVSQCQYPNTQVNWKPVDYSSFRSN